MEKELFTAIEAAIEAGNVIMEIYNKDFSVAFKEDASPLTEADKAGNAIIMTFLAKTSHPIISEENKEVPFEIRKEWSTCWIVDPLDGTKEFVKKNGEFTVNIALIENNKPAMGVIYVPASGQLYYGVVSQKTAYTLKIENHQPLSKDQLMEKSEEIFPSSNSDVIRVVGSRSHMNQETLDYMEALKNRTSKPLDVVSKGSSLKLCLVAEGSAEVYPRFAPTMEWDTAAGHAICNAVGIPVTDMHTHNEMLYNKANLLNPYFLVANEGSIT